ncbi:MAG: molybdopterin-guanine dinucleotide biosynthesis protein B [Pseudomonadota bacterium]
MTPVFGITGWKNSGKTTLVSRVVEDLTARGYRVSTVKHAHETFDIDHPGTDSFKHRTAGAVEVALVSKKRWAIMHELRGDQEPSLMDVLKSMAPCDLVIIEGYKREPHPKIECRRVDARDTKPLFVDDPSIVALASDQPQTESDRPVFDLNAIEQITDFIEAFTGLSGDHVASRAS